MNWILIQLDDVTYKALNQVAPTANRRAEFIRQALKDLIRPLEMARMQQAYLSQPDSPEEANDWTIREEFKA